jgi:hypothetical protein
MLDDMRVVGVTSSEMRSIERAGANELMGRVFQGFIALPAPPGGRSGMINPAVKLQDLQTRIGRREKP